MNPKAFLLIVLAVVVILAVIIGVGYWIASRRAGINRAEFNRVKAERSNALKTIARIESEVESHSDIDHPLAAKLRPILKRHNEERNEILG